MMPAARILVADNDAASAKVLTQLLTTEGYQVRVVETIDEALSVCASDPPDLVVIDLVEPQGHGFEVCRSLKGCPATRLIPTVMVTSPSDRRDRLTSIEAGCDDFITKPFEEAELRARIRSLLRLKSYTDELESAETVMLGLGAMIEARDPCTRGHCQRLARYATHLGRLLGLDDNDLAALERGGFLHDIGKIAVPDRVLLKGGALDAQESRVMREHPVVGDALCAGLRSFTRVRPIVRHHHERLDGSGYPDGLRNSDVPLLAQIIGVVDVFDALTTERPYRSAMARDDGLEVLAGEAKKGRHDRALVDAFVSVAETM
jgi:putative two-component system response regulator